VFSSRRGPEADAAPGCAGLFAEAADAALAAFQHHRVGRCDLGSGLRLGAVAIALAEELEIVQTDVERLVTLGVTVIWTTM